MHATIEQNIEPIFIIIVPGREKRGYDPAPLMLNTHRIGRHIQKRTIVSFRSGIPHAQMVIKATKLNTAFAETQICASFGQN